jgi:VanZ family protein
MNSARRSHLVWIVAANIVYAAILVRAALMARPYRVPVLGQMDWIAHGLAYGIQTVLLFLLTRRTSAQRPALVAAATGALIFGTAVEHLQLLQPTRYFQFTDLIANAVGVMLAVSVIVICTRGTTGP